MMSHRNSTVLILCFYTNEYQGVLPSPLFPGGVFPWLLVLMHLCGLCPAPGACLRNNTPEAPEGNEEQGILLGSSLCGKHLKEKFKSHSKERYICYQLCTSWFSLVITCLGINCLVEKIQTFFLEACLCTVYSGILLQRLL